MNTNNNMGYLISKVLFIFTLISVIFSQTACSRAPKPVAETYVPEPVVIVDEPQAMEPPPEEEPPLMVESSGIEPPVEENTMMDMAPASLRDTPADYYAIQVVASSSMKQLEAFAAANNLSTDLTATITVNNKTWNVLIYGTYPTLTEAKEAMPEVRTKVTTRPWIRTVGSLH